MAMQTIQFVSVFSHLRDQETGIDVYKDDRLMPYIDPDIRKIKG